MYKKISLAIVSSLIFTFIIGINYTEEQSITDTWEGNWYLPSESVSFELFITKKDNELTGAHCWTDQLSAGEDCTPSNKFSLTNPVVIDTHSKEFTFRTYYGLSAENESDYYGKVKLTLQDENTLLWEITEQPEGRTVIPDELTLERYQE